MPGTEALNFLEKEGFMCSASVSLGSRGPYFRAWRSLGIAFSVSQVRSYFEEVSVLLCTANPNQGGERIWQAFNAMEFDRLKRWRSTISLNPESTLGTLIPILLVFLKFFSWCRYLELLGSPTFSVDGPVWHLLHLQSSSLHGFLQL